MSNPDNGNRRGASYSPGSLRDLVSRAITDPRSARRAYDELRGTYLKVVKLKFLPKKEYWRVFPASVLPPIIEKARVHEGERERLRDFRFSVRPGAVCFIRSLWFAHQFFSEPLKVLEFFRTSKPEKRLRLFQNRLDELQELSKTYGHWSKSSPQISEWLKRFDPTKTDLLTLSEAPTSTTAPKEAAGPLPGSAAVADFIREVERRPSYRAGDPGDACEKALYFLALGRGDIAERIASEARRENPKHAVALYANAVLLLYASERHQRQAFIHDLMHPHGLEPVEAEEFYHAARHSEESLQAREKEQRAFQLMLKARQNWPKQFLIKCFDLSPSMWLHKVDEWILRRAAACVASGPAALGLPEGSDDAVASKALAGVVSDIWKTGERWMLKPFWVGRLPDFIVVAALVRPKVARDCLKKLEAALGRAKPDEAERTWSDSGVVLPVSEEPTLAEMLIPAATNACFSRAIFHLKPAAEAAALLGRIARVGVAEELDRRAAMRSLALRAVVLNVAHGGGSGEAAQLCREIAEDLYWPATETGGKLRACWRYAVVLMLFEASRTAFEANDVSGAVKHASTALGEAVESLATIDGEEPLLKFIESDEDGERGIIGDLLRRQPNIVTDGCPSDFFPSALPWARLQGGRMPCWDGFVEWAGAEAEKKAPLLLAYGRWLALHHGQGDLLLAKCDALAVKLEALKPK